MSSMSGRVSIPIWLVTSGLILMALGALALSLSIGALTAPTATAAVLYDEDRVVSLFEGADPAVVIVEVESEARSRRSFGFPFSDPDFGWGFGLPPGGDEYVFPSFGQGSGFLVDAEGHIFTNHHVVDDAKAVTVVLSDGTRLDAEVRGYSSWHDVALLKVDAAAVSGIQPLPMADSSLVKPGQMAVAIGSPHGLENTVTVGVVSGIERSHGGVAPRPITGMIQTDATLTSGNSGGPLLNSSGEVIGINTSIEIAPNGPSGIGFAVPINTAKNLMTRLEDGLSLSRPWLGIGGGALTEAIAETLGVDVTEGVYLSQVFPDSPAAEAGLVASSVERTLEGTQTTVGDIITAVDGTKVTSVEDIIAHFNSKQPGDSVTLTLHRDGGAVDVDVTLGEWPDE
ncbi:MAG: trypsin-like peptidase domain-containing protein [Chloroflexota bacterium]|nr:trypsin-like peptidase domain-containing protein [Chloroflexota bacterium]MDE2942346.1 trypsin-like peptidase domain-containing protein [Chloroflexota bacterium]MDE3268249.1 trypsin-like peptidase domain-containing protein [Chloroflexota bacterium]